MARVCTQTFPQPTCVRPEAWALLRTASLQSAVESNEHLEAYGTGYEMRLTGHHETCRYDEFKYGVSDRTASIRIPAQVAVDGCGYLEDRRPNANADRLCGRSSSPRKRLRSR